MLFLTNTLSSKKELFTPTDAHNITLYVCGITPYDYAHIGHGRCYVTFDVVYRLLKTMYPNITYCRNFTDIDDKILTKAQQELNDKYRYQEISEKFISAYHQDMQKLNCLPPTHEPRVTQTIPEIINLIQQLISNDYAYQVDGDVYYRVTKFAQYGALSKRNIDDLQAGARVEINEKKENPLDFALWKQDDGFWQSPWGIGRPGWHIECSAMAEKYFGASLDIHGGGMDLIFPHHENEIAQSEGAHRSRFARTWIHNAFVRINKEKMSKSLGNFFTLRDVFEKYDPMVIRYYILQHHYRSPLDFAFDDIEGAQKAYQKLCKVFAAIPSTNISSQMITQSAIAQKMMAFLYDDLNTPGALGVVFENLDAPLNELSLVKSILQNLLGLTLHELKQPTVVITSDIQKLIDERAAARTRKDWKESDRLRDELVSLGVEVKDNKL